jgi:hypothetical protein
VPELRRSLPLGLQRQLDTDSAELAVPISVRDKIAARHPLDAAALERVGELLDGWELAGMSPKGDGRLELYGRLDNMWFTAVIKSEATTAINVLITAHRVYARKVRSRERKGHLIARGERG